MERCGHAATVFSGCAQEILITIGGVGEDWDTLNECWVMNIADNKYKKVHYDHLMTM